MKILVLCHGNVNRSPACEAVLRSQGLDASSAGFTHANRRASRKMRRRMAHHGYDMEAHRSRPVTREMLLDPSLGLVVYMDGGNLRRIEALLEGAAPAIRPPMICLGSCIGAPRIEDPAFMKESSEEFRATVDKIITASLKLAEKIK